MTLTIRPNKLLLLFRSFLSRVAQNERGQVDPNLVARRAGITVGQVLFVLWLVLVAYMLGSLAAFWSF